MKLGLASALAFVGTVFAANWMIYNVGTVETPNGVHLIPVWFGPLYAPSGVLFIGLALLLRDSTQYYGGRWLVLAAIFVGAVCSALVDTSLALASGLAFLVSELCDFGVYSRLSERTLIGGVVASNVVGAVVDSALFLWIAFGSLAFIEGQIVGKLLVTAAALPFLIAARRLRDA